MLRRIDGFGRFVDQQPARAGAYSFLQERFLNYNFEGSTDLASVPAADWDAGSGKQWTVPLGVTVGPILHPGKLPPNAQVGAYKNAVNPDFESRVPPQFMFPK